MLAYIKGKVVSKQLDHIIVECNNMGFKVFFSQFDSVNLNEDVCIYVYENIREDEYSLYGFKSQYDYDLFTKLISVKGLGPKTAMNIFRASNAANIIKAIEGNDLAYIKKLPGIGAKSASQIILDLKGKLVQDVKDSTSDLNTEISDAIEGLKALGYKANEINAIIGELKNHEGLTSDEYLKLGLQLIMKRKIGG